MRNTPKLQDPATVKTVEAHLIGQIAEAEQRIREITEEKHVLERMLLKLRQQSVIISRTEVTRKNSLNRVLVENSVLESLALSPGKAVKTWRLYEDARLIIRNLREATFRSILHRMKLRGLIKSRENGWWEPVSQTPETNSAKQRG